MGLDVLVGICGDFEYVSLAFDYNVSSITDHKQKTKQNQNNAAFKLNPLAVASFKITQHLRR